MTGISEATIEYLVNHVVLPPRLPHSKEDDETIRGGEKALVDMLIDQVKCFTRLPGSENEWQIIQSMLHNVRKLCSVTKPSSDTISGALKILRDGGRSFFNPWYVR